MALSRKTLFISDLHLQESEPEITRAFLQLLDGADASVDAIYILGDLFEAWIGDDDETPYHQQIIKALRAATTKGLRIYFMPGNRDFLVGKKFLRESGCILLQDEEKINLYGTPTLLMHGDTLCMGDDNYIRMRKFMRNPIIQRIFLWLPLSTRRKVADRMRAASKKHMQSLTMDMMDVTPDEVVKVMHKHGVQSLIHGHTHRPNVHALTVNDKPAARIVLAAWHGRGSALICDETGNKQLVSL